MADFYQTGIITTLHRLGELSLDLFEAELVGFAEVRPLTLVIPALASEMDGPALPVIVQELRGVPYLHRVVVGLDAATQTDFERARQFFRVLPQRTHILWRDGPRLQELYQRLELAGIFTGVPGKGRIVCPVPSVSRRGPRASSLAASRAASPPAATARPARAGI